MTKRMAFWAVYKGKAVKTFAPSYRGAKMRLAERGFPVKKVNRA